MKIIDFHTHIYPTQIAERATKSVLDFYEFKHKAMVGSPEVLLESGRQAGIEQFVVLPVAIKSGHVRSINNFIIDQCKQHSEFFGFGTVHAEMNNILDEAEYILNSGLKGVKMHPDTQLFNIDDERLFPLYDYLSDRLPVMLHCGDDRFDYSHPRRLRRVMNMFPKLRVIATHLGGYTVWDDAAEALGDTDCFVDISSSLMFMDSASAKKYMDIYGSDRLLFGTDFPLWDLTTEVERFMQLEMSDAVRERIAYKNAERILKADAKNS